MANFHPELYAWLCEDWEAEPETAARLQDFLGFASLIERQTYPVNAKYFLQLEGLPVTLHTRTRDPHDLTSAGRLEVQQFRAVAQRYARVLGVTARS
jgi:4-hydroxy-tetrahydrodipicolinate synthase